jgi:anti-anti-sigma factor
VRPTLEISSLVDVVGIKLTGEVDLATAHQLTEALASISTESEVHLELAELAFMDSSGLRTILAFAGSRNGAGPVILVNPSDAIQRLLAITGLAQHPKIELRHTRA